MKQMKQKVFMMLVAMLAVMCLIGCESKDNESGKKTVKFTKAEEKMKEDPDEEKEPDEEPDEAPDEEPDIIDDYEPEEMYQAFLDGECGLYLDDNYIDNTGYLSIYLEDGEIYYLEDILDQLKDVADYESSDMEEEEADVRYAYIDCGNDGQEELVIQVSSNSLGEEFTANYVITCKEGQLYLCYDIDSWSRRSVEINEYGYIRDGGSGGAGCHSGQDLIIGSDGDSNEVYQWQTVSCSGWELESEYATANQIEEIKQEWLEENNYSTDALGDLEISMFIIDGVDYYTYYVSEEYEEAEDFIEKCQDAGIYFSSWEEVEYAIEEQMESLGLEGLESGADIEFQSL